MNTFKVYGLILLSIFSFGCSGGNGSSSNGGGLLKPTLLPTKAVQNPNPGAGLVVVYGDSLAVGQGAKDPANTIQNCVGRNFGVATDVLAQGGATTDDGLAHIDDLLALKPRVVVISLAGNDVLTVMAGGVFPDTKTFSNLRSIYRKLIANNVMVVQLGLNPPIAGAERLPAIKALAESEGALYVPDILEGLWTDPTMMTDRVHPNDAGYQKVCQRVTNSLLPYYQTAPLSFLDR